MAVVFVSIWVYKDAKQRGLSAGMWTFLVVLSGTFIGLILYLLIGRKQRYCVCDKCGAAINIQGAFCPKCGETIVESKRIVTKNKGLLYVSIAFVTLVFVLIGIGIYTYRTVGGFAPLYKYEIHSGNISGSVKNVTINSFDDTWTFSYDEATEGYTISNIYNATAKPTALSIEITGDGSFYVNMKCEEGDLTLIISQGKVEKNIELLSGLAGTFDMSDFREGLIKMVLVIKKGKKVKARIGWRR